MNKVDSLNAVNLAKHFKKKCYKSKALSVFIFLVAAFSATYLMSFVVISTISRPWTERLLFAVLAIYSFRTLLRAERLISHFREEAKEMKVSWLAVKAYNENQN